MKKSRQRIRTEKQVARQAYLKESLPAPFEHLNGAWWSQVIDRFDEVQAACRDHDARKAADPEDVP